MNHTYKIIEIVGSSEKDLDDAIRTAIKKASATVRNMRWFEVLETRGQIDNNEVAYWQVTLKIGFTVDD